VPGNVENILRRKYFKSTLKRYSGSGYYVTGIEIKGHHNIIFGANCNIAANCFIHAHAGDRIEISENFLMNSNSCINATEKGELKLAKTYRSLKMS